MKRLLLWLSVLVGIPIIAYAANTCTNADQACYVTGPYSNPTTVYRIDAAGNVTANGNSTVTGNTTMVGNSTTTAKMFLARTQSVGVTSITVISPTSTYMVVASTGGNVTCGLSVVGAGSSAAPCISTSTAVDGQYLVISATQTSNVVTFSSATASGMDLGNANRAVKYGNVLTLIYDGILNVWKEVSFAAN